MSKDNLREVDYQGNNALFHQWIIKESMNESGENEQISYALIELENGSLEETVYKNIKFK